MSLDRITKQNYLSKKGPFLTVYSGWYNALVDHINTIFGSINIEDGEISVSNVAGTMNVPFALVPAWKYRLFDDFDYSIASAAPHATWTITEDDAACTQLLIDELGGVLQLTNKAVTDDNAQQIQSQQETFRLVAGKELWFEARVRCPAADVTNLDLFIGLAETEDLTGVANNMPANGVGFTKTDAGVGTIFLASSDNGTDIVTAASLHTLVTNTWTRLGFHFNGGATGLATITPYINGVAGQSISAATYATMTELAPTFMVRNGDATTQQKLDIDYVNVVQDR